MARRVSGRTGRLRLTTLPNHCVWETSYNPENEYQNV